LFGRWVPLALLAFLVAYGPLLAYNLRSGLDSLHHGLVISHAYKVHPEFRHATYLTNLGLLGLGLLEVVGGDFRLTPTPWTDPFLLLEAALALGGLLWALRRGGYWLAPLAMLCTAALLPAFNPKYTLVLNGRYLLLLLPLVLVAEA